jgi:transposase
MPKSHKPNPPAVREQPVALVRRGRDPQEFARKFELAAQSIRNWLVQANRKPARGETVSRATSTRRAL